MEEYDVIRFQRLKIMAGKSCSLNMSSEVTPQQSERKNGRFYCSLPDLTLALWRNVSTTTFGGTFPTSSLKAMQQYL